jgi:hypothetical protein
MEPINYQVGDVIESKDQRYVNFKSKVLDITEKGIVVQFLGYDVAPFTISHQDSHLMTKSKAGTILYGNKDKEHSKS